MKKAILIITVVLSFAGLNGLNAQKQNFEGNGNHRLDKLEEELGLTETQTEQIKSGHDEFRTEMQEMRKDETLSQEAFHEALQQKREDHHSQIRNILNEEQKQKFDLLTEERGNRQYAKRPQNKRHSFLSEEQLSELKEKRIEFDNELSADEKEIIAEFRLKREERKSENQAECKKDGVKPRHGHRGFKQDREEMQPMIDIVKNHKESLMAILEEYRPERPENCSNDHLQRNKQGRAGFEKRPGFMAIHFLMMDTQTINMGNADDTSLELEIFPNPARNLVSISYDLSNEGNVTIELLNKNGEVVELIDQSYQNKGQNEVNFDAGKLIPGEMYLIKVSSDQGVQVDKFIKM